MEKYKTKTLELMDTAIKAIDDKFGKGTSTREPGLVSAFMISYSIIKLDDEISAILPISPDTMP